MPKLTLSKINDSAYRLLDAHGNHIGNLKLISAQWKFKAIGYDPNGDVIPGGGPLTDRHNMVFADLDLAALADRLLLD